MWQRIGQVIASLLIIQRVADKSALTSNTLAPGNISSFRARSQGGLTGGSGALPGETPIRFVGEHWKSTSEFGGEVGPVTDFHLDKD